jgi:hypothetical protein
MRILLYIYGKCVSEDVFCNVVKACEKRDMGTLIICFEYRRRYGTFTKTHERFFERVLDGK